MRVFLGIPTVGDIPHEVYESHLHLAAEIAKHADLATSKVHNIFPHDMARLAIVEAAIGCDADYIMWVDMDMFIPPNSFVWLLEAIQSPDLVKAGARLVTGHTYRRGYPYTNTWTIRVPNQPNSNEDLFEVFSPPDAVPVQITSCGLACALLDLRWAKDNLTEPWFYQGWISLVNTEASSEAAISEQLNSTPVMSLEERSKFVWEDGYFCSKIRNAGGTIFGVPKVRTGHLTDSSIIVDDSTAELLRRDYRRNGQPTKELQRKFVTMPS